MDQTVQKLSPSSAKAAGTQNLTPQQWQGLARLADMVNNIDSSLQGSSGNPFTGAVQELSQSVSDYDLPTLLISALESLKAYQESGLLKKAQDNAALINDSIDLLTPLTGELVEKLKEFSFAEIKQELTELRTVYKKIAISWQLLEKYFVPEISQNLIDSAAFWQENELQDSLADFLKTVSHLHKTGTFERIREFSDYLAVVNEQIDFDALMKDSIAAIKNVNLDKVGRLSESLDKAMEDASRHESTMGGASGLFRLLRNKDVQKGLRTLSILPVYLDKLSKS